jgi:DNA-binding FadR family transcriptional regulator
MTRQQESRRISPPAREADILAPVPHGGKLTDVIVDRLSGEIASGRLAPGQRLPTEQEMVLAMKVSRTVVREAVAALKARGLVTTRQGSGAFVSKEPARRAFKLDPELLRSLDSVVDVLELRLAVETEAAGLAAARGGPAGMRLVRDAHARFEAALDRGDSGADEDFACHMAIAAATGNPHFAEFLRFLGTIVIPRRDPRVWDMAKGRREQYLGRIRDEHARIVDAILARDAERARAAMREHLHRAAQRYRQFAGAAKAGGGKPLAAAFSKRPGSAEKQAGRRAAGA